MHFKPALWDGSDPLYAPCLQWPKPTNPYWRAPKKYRDAGYVQPNVPLEGHKGDGRDAERAARCRELTQDLVKWWQGETHVDADTWAYVIARYKGDEYSPIKSVKANTRAGYLEQIAKLELAIGHIRIEALTYETVMQMKIAMQKKGRSNDYIRRLFTTLRRISKYGVALKIPGTMEASVILSQVKLPSTAPRSVYPTREEVTAIVDAATERGMLGFATGYSLCYELILRAVDVRGQWLEGEGGINRGGKYWQDGLTWDMISSDFTRIRKVVSKTAKSLPEEYEWDIRPLPELQERLQALKERSGGVGPVIISERTGLPYTVYGWSQAFRRLRDDLGLRPELTAMDVRAGGVTEAKAMVRDAYSLRDAAQHKQLSTTDRYARSRSDGANKVIQMRRTK